MFCRLDLFVDMLSISPHILHFSLRNIHICTNLLQTVQVWSNGQCEGFVSTIEDLLENSVFALLYRLGVRWLAGSHLCNLVFPSDMSEICLGHFSQLILVNVPGTKLSENWDGTHSKTVICWCSSGQPGTSPIPENKT